MDEDGLEQDSDDGAPSSSSKGKKVDPFLAMVEKAVGRRAQPAQPARPA